MDAGRRVVVITGASSGIGLELARQLSSNTPGAYALLLVARRGELLQAACTELREAHGTTCSYVAADVSKRESSALVLRAALEEYGRLDVWVNNAGRGVVCPALELEEPLVDEMLNANRALPPF
jgi:short-subunit dehydrogenase